MKVNESSLILAITSVLPYVSVASGKRLVWQENKSVRKSFLKNIFWSIFY